MFAIGNEELEGRPQLGKSIKCGMCGKRHKILYGTKNVDGVQVESKMLAFYRCGGKPYLAGINGMDVRGVGCDT